MLFGDLNMTEKWTKREKQLAVLSAIGLGAFGLLAYWSLTPKHVRIITPQYARVTVHNWQGEVIYNKDINIVGNEGHDNIPLPIIPSEKAVIMVSNLA